MVTEPAQTETGLRESLRQDTERFSTPRQESSPKYTNEMLYNIAKVVGAHNYFFPQKENKQMTSIPKLVKNYSDSLHRESLEGVDTEGMLSTAHETPQARSTKMYTDENKFSIQKVKENQRARTAVEEIKVPTTLPKNERSKTMANFVTEAKKKLFEDFFVIGADLQSIEKIKTKDPVFIQPKRLFQYPNLPENKNW